MKFRKKPVEIEAVQFDGINVIEILDKLDAMGESWFYDKHKQMLQIPTLEGIMVADKDDWIIKGVKGEFYPCKPDIFEMTYEPVICGEPMPEIIYSSDIPFGHDETYLASNLCPGCMKPKQLCTHKTTACIG